MRLTLTETASAETGQEEHLNPRVFFPFLPHGYEERVGLDRFGREVQR